jgi:hypothetical protein
MLWIPQQKLFGEFNFDAYWPIVIPTSHEIETEHKIEVKYVLP